MTSTARPSVVEQRELVVALLDRAGYFDAPIGAFGADFIDLEAPQTGDGDEFRSWLDGADSTTMSAAIRRLNKLVFGTWVVDPGSALHRLGHDADRDDVLWNLRRALLEVLLAFSQDADLTETPDLLVAELRYMIGTAPESLSTVDLFAELEVLAQGLADKNQNMLIEIVDKIRTIKSPDMSDERIVASRVRVAAALAELLDHLAAELFSGIEPPTRSRRPRRSLHRLGSVFRRKQDCSAGAIPFGDDP